MDLRITNTCNNNCLYCLEQEYRAKEKYIPKEEIFLQLQKNTDTHITFYGGNPLLHPHIEEIISFCQQQNKYQGIGILSNTF